MYYFTLFNIPPLYLHGHTHVLLYSVQYNSIIPPWSHPCITLLYSIYLHYTSMVTPMYYFTLFNIPPLYLHGHTNVLLYSVQYNSIIPPWSHPCITLLCSIYLHYTSMVTPMYYFTLFNITPLYLHGHTHVLLYSVQYNSIILPWSHPCITLFCSI